MTYTQIREEEIKNKIARDYFSDFDCTKIIGNIDFCVSIDFLLETESLFWAEAKKGNSDSYRAIVQLILTIGKARSFDKQLPPAFLGAFDSEKIAFIPYNAIQDIFYQNDFNWNVTPSNYETKEFKLVYEKVKETIDKNALLFNYEKDNAELKKFIKSNFIFGKLELTKTKIDKNNFMIIYNKWLQTVKPTIAVHWDFAKKYGIIDGDFYLADLLSQENVTLKEKLFVILKYDYYELDKKIDEYGLFSSQRTEFSDKQIAHTQFWNRYERPPKEQYWDYIINRRDLLVPQDIRERKGSFFTPQIWVELSQQYLANVLGENWQDEYTIWDCAAGTGNLLTGLTNKYNIWASTLDKQDVEVIKDRIRNGANLLESNVFQFDFLNDDFSKLPKPLLDIINNPKKRKKLVIYINPPYAEATSYGLKSKQGVSSNNKIYGKYKSLVGSAINELFIQFFIRIYKEIPNCKIASFSKLKYINAQAFDKFRIHFKAENLASFVCRASTFDNVKGAFPIGFLIWNLASKLDIKILESDVILNNNSLTHCWQEGTKSFYASKKGTFIIDWLRQYFDKKSERIGYLRIQGTDIQQNRTIFVTSKPSDSDFRESKVMEITKNNLIASSIYFTLRSIIKPTWLNDRDQYLYPNDGWQNDKEFQNNCLTYTLFNNNIQSQHGINHWIPFTEHEVNAQAMFESHFMNQFINGQLIIEKEADLYNDSTIKHTEKLVFSDESKAVFDAGRALWRYYHSLSYCNVNAALYDIREYFQGRNDKGKMNNKSEDAQYTLLMNALKASLKTLSKTIEPKIYEYGFLMK